MFEEITSGIDVDEDLYENIIFTIKKINTNSVSNQNQVSTIIQLLDKLHSDFSTIFCDNEDLRFILDIYYKHFLLIKDNEGTNFNKTIYNIKFCLRLITFFIGFA